MTFSLSEIRPKLHAGQLEGGGLRGHGAAVSIQISGVRFGRAVRGLATKGVQTVLEPSAKVGRWRVPIQPATPKKSIGAAISPNSSPSFEYRYLEQQPPQLLSKPKWIVNLSIIFFYLFAMGKGVLPGL
ncbi:hypothetical protein H0G86_005566 [Trichoderma simmonsii]|uniref:Uncharacterized protein n=1 Tax=Trichoderma simmonsii TaxID=1491479 RepID=A0A8G0PGH9_9HYPO|nr:hypothetical protein H0G86_005566 [Trichoderma simmonsii]